MGLFNFKNKEVKSATINKLYEFRQPNGDKILINLNLIQAADKFKNDKVRIFIGTEKMVLDMTYDELKQLIQDRS